MATGPLFSARFLTIVITEPQAEGFSARLILRFNDEEADFELKRHFDVAGDDDALGMFVGSLTAIYWRNRANGLCRLMDRYGSGVLRLDSSTE